MAKKKSKNTKKKARNKSFAGTVLKWLFVAGLWAGIIVGCMVAWYASELPAITKGVSFKNEATITVKAADGSILARYGDIRGDSVTVETLPPHLIYAVMAIEDRRFYQHFGIDPIGFARAMFVNLRAARLVQGGSTITQQLAKNLFLSQERTIKRKIQEAILAIWLERELTKDEILSAYLNRVYLGSGTYGVDAAAKLYFEKPVEEINLREAAMIAGLLKAPSRYSPLRNPELANERANVVLKAMNDAGYITNAQAKEADEIPANLKKNPYSTNSVRYFTDWVVDGLKDLIGTPEENIIVETTLNPTLQKTAEEALVNVIQTHGEERVISQGAVIAMRPNGAVVTMVGGANYAESQFNRAVQAKRQPGSSFKPLVYLTALQNGWTPGTLVVDEPITQGRYRPSNYAGKYYGEVRLDTALALSLNTVSVQLMREIGPAPVIENARRFGIFSKLQPDLSLALGTSSVSPLEMTTAYAVIANGGYSVFPYAITKITGEEDGKLYYSRAGDKGHRQVSDSASIQELQYMMQGVIQFGTGQGANPGFPAAGKTGTSQNYGDAWFIGFTDELVASVWLGNDDNTEMKRVTGGSFPAQIWKTVMARGHGLYAPVRYNNIWSGSFQRLMDRLSFRTGNEPRREEQQGRDRKVRIDWNEDTDVHEEQSHYND